VVPAPSKRGRGPGWHRLLHTQRGCNPRGWPADHRIRPRTRQLHLHSRSAGGPRAAGDSDSGSGISNLRKLRKNFSLWVPGRSPSTDYPPCT
jgi:hypothetical protein